MKKVYILVSLICCTISLAAQECTDLYFMQGPKTVTMTQYDTRGKKTGTLLYTVVEVNNRGDSIVSDMFIESMNARGKTNGTLKGQFVCTGGVIKYDMKLGLPQFELTGKKSLQYTGDYLEYPLNMQVGSMLKNSSYTISGGRGLFKYIYYEITFRKVSGKETITTPAGTWECFRISYKGRYYFDEKKRNGMDASGMEFYAPDFGVVKTETPYYTLEVTDIK